jgi:CubicO group peptidase (beta-lactamase class C family)
MAVGGFSKTRLVLLGSLLQRLVDGGYAPGAVAVLARRGHVHVDAVGTLAFGGPTSTTPMGLDTICRLGSMSKPIVSACAMSLVDDGVLGLDDPVDDLLPELSNMRVLRDPCGALDDTTPAHRAITVRDLLTYTFGSGIVVAEPGRAPIADALNAIGPMPADQWIARLGALPLVHQPGERWMYHTAANVTGVLIARATGMTLGDAVRERVCEPLGMSDTCFSVPEQHLDRFSTAYALDAATGALVPDDESHGSFRGPPLFESGGGGLVSTAADVLTFARALMMGGSSSGRRILSHDAVALMTRDQLTAQQKSVSGFWPGYFDSIGWGFGVSVRATSAAIGPAVGTYGWPGYFGTAWYNDPVEDLTTIVMMQRAHAGDQRLAMWTEIWAAVYQSLE